MENNLNNQNTNGNENNVINPQGAYYVPQTVPLKKEYTPLSKKENTFIFIVLAGLFIAVDFTVYHGFALGFTISYALIFAITTAFIYKKDAKNKAFSFICGALSLVLSIGNTLFDNSFIKPVSVLIVLFLFALYCLGISGGIGRLAGSYKLMVDLFFKTAAAPFENLEKVFGGIKAGAKDKKGSFGAFIGILVALPALLVIIPLLVSSDAAFEGLVSSVVDNIGIYLLELVIAVAVLPFFYSYLFSRNRNEKSKEKTAKESSGKFPISACTAFLSVISLTYIVYLFSQLAYFFSAFRGILPKDYPNTASAFARRGFYEMFALCVINVALVSLVSHFCERKNKKHPIIIKVLSTFISLFSVLLIIIAMQKMRLNISIYGLSVNRILVSAFMLMMLFVIAFFILHIFFPKLKYMQPIIIICSVIFIALTFSDIDRISAEYNIGAYNSGELEKLDVDAISNMSSSAVPYLVKLTESKDEKIAKKAKEEVAKKIFYGDLRLSDDKKTLRIYDEAKDFREYNKVRVNSLNQLKHYFDSQPDKEKQKLITKYY